MPPKVKFTKEQVLDAAFLITNTEGFDSITIRKVADKLGASIAPIYVNFKNLDELKHALAQMIAELTTNVMLSQETHDPFLDIGAGNIRLAIDYTQLYRDFFFNPNCKKYFETNHSNHNSKLVEKMSTSPKLKGFDTVQMVEILQTMAFVTSGIIFEYLVGRMDINYEETIKQLEDIADDVIAGYKIRKGIKL